MYSPVRSSTSHGEGVCRGAALLGPEIQGKAAMLPTKLPGLAQSLVQPRGVQQVLQPLVGSHCPKLELS